MNNTSSQRVSTIQCPVCKTSIPASISELLIAGGLTCPSCGLQLSMDRNQSQKALDALKKVEEAQKRVDKKP